MVIVLEFNLCKDLSVSAVFLLLDEQFAAIQLWC